MFFYFWQVKIHLELGPISAYSCSIVSYPLLILTYLYASLPYPVHPYRTEALSYPTLCSPYTPTLPLPHINPTCTQTRPILPSPLPKNHTPTCPHLNPTRTQTCPRPAISLTPNPLRNLPYSYPTRNPSLLDDLLHDIVSSKGLIQDSAALGCDFKTSLKPSLAKKPLAELCMSEKVTS